MGMFFFRLPFQKDGTLPPTSMEPDVCGVLSWTIFLLKGPPNVRFHVHWWEGILF